MPRPVQTNSHSNSDSKTKRDFLPFSSESITVRTGTPSTKQNHVSGYIKPLAKASRAGHTKRSLSILTFISVLGVFASLSTLTACSNSQPSPSASQSNTTESEQPPKEPPTWPLTGEYLPEGTDAAHPSVSVKVENSPSARPQSGLESADIVWEEMIEGGLTRYNAIFHSQLPAQIGPVRSVRPMDVPISLPLNGLFICSGGIPFFEQSARSAGLHLYNEDDALGALHRVNFRRMPHNLYLNAQELVGKFGKELKAPEPQFIFANPLLSDHSGRSSVHEYGQEQASLKAQFPAFFATWTWDGAQEKWMRTDDAQPTVTPEGSALGAKNVVAIMANSHDTGYKDPAGAPVIETELSGSGNAYIAADGRVMAATWVKDSPGEPLRLLDCKGKDVLLSPGNTWVELLPAPSSFEPAVAKSCQEGS